VREPQGLCGRVGFDTYDRYVRPIPPLWTSVIAAGQRGLVHVTGGPRDYPGRRVLAVGLGLSAAALYGAVGWKFTKAGTTIDPRAPHKTKALVTSGVFGRSRNPIYVADALMLASHAAWQRRRHCRSGSGMSTTPTSLASPAGSARGADAQRPSAPAGIAYRLVAIQTV